MSVLHGRVSRLLQQQVRCSSPISPNPTLPTSKRLINTIFRPVRQGGILGNVKNRFRHLQRQVVLSIVLPSSEVVRKYRISEFMALSALETDAMRHRGCWDYKQHRTKRD